MGTGSPLRARGSLRKDDGDDNENIELQGLLSTKPTSELGTRLVETVGMKAKLGMTSGKHSTSICTTWCRFAKTPLPVAVRRSKTPRLNLPISLSPYYGLQPRLSAFWGTAELATWVASEHAGGQTITAIVSQTPKLWTIVRVKVMR